MVLYFGFEGVRLEFLLFVGIAFLPFEGLEDILQLDLPADLATDIFLPVLALIHNPIDQILKIDTEEGGLLAQCHHNPKVLALKFAVLQQVHHR